MASTRDVVEGLYDAIKRGDQEAFFSLIDDDVFVEEPRFLLAEEARVQNGRLSLCEYSSSTAARSFPDWSDDVLDSPSGGKNHGSG